MVLVSSADQRTHPFTNACLASDNNADIAVNPDDSVGFHELATPIFQKSDDVGLAVRDGGLCRSASLPEMASSVPASTVNPPSISGKTPQRSLIPYVMFNTPCSNFSLSPNSSCLVDDSFTRYNVVNPGYMAFIRCFGYSDRDAGCPDPFGYAVYSCRLHGRMIYPRYSVREVGRLHPLKRLDSLRRNNSALVGKLERLEGKLGAPLVMTNMVLTFPARISRELGRDPRSWDGIKRKVSRAFYRELCAEYGEGVGVDGNLHVWRDWENGGEMYNPLLHLDLDVLNVRGDRKTLERVDGDGRGLVIYSAERIKEIWVKALYSCFDGEVLRLEDGRMLDADNVNVWMRCHTISKKGRLMHHLRYRKRRPVVDLWNWCLHGKSLRSEEWDADFARGLLEYKNRSFTYGVWRYLSRHAGEKKSDGARRCPVCGEIMERLVNVGMLPDDVLLLHMKKGRVIVVPPPGGFLEAERERAERVALRDEDGAYWL